MSPMVRTPYDTLPLRRVGCLPPQGPASLRQDGRGGRQVSGKDHNTRGEKLLKTTRHACTKITSRLTAVNTQ